MLSPGDKCLPGERPGHHRLCLQRLLLKLCRHFCQHYTNHVFLQLHFYIGVPLANRDPVRCRCAWRLRLRNLPLSIPEEGKKHCREEKYQKSCLQKNDFS